MTGTPISIVNAPSEEDEAKFIADEMQRIHYERRRKLKDFAILYRTNTQARALEEALHSARIKFDTHGGLKFFDRKEVKDVIAYLRACDNHQDDVSMARIVNTPRARHRRDDAGAAARAGAAGGHAPLLRVQARRIRSPTSRRPRCKAFSGSRSSSSATRR